MLTDPLELAVDAVAGETRTLPPNPPFPARKYTWPPLDVPFPPKTDVAPPVLEPAVVLPPERRKGEPFEDPDCTPIENIMVPDAPAVPTSPTDSVVSPLAPLPVFAPVEIAIPPVAPFTTEFAV
jgi:hypothetical protein